MAKILVVEDEVDLAKLLRMALEREHHLVETTDNGADALAHLQVNKFDVVILDLMLPSLSGMEVCRRYRQSKGKTPILMLTAKVDVNDKAAGLDAGADDYLTKPFDLKELNARVRALIRRSSNLANNVYHLRDIEIDVNEFRVTKGGEEVHLLPKEFRLLEFLVRHPHHVFSAEELLASVWESDTAALLDTVRGHIKRLRKKLDTPGLCWVCLVVCGIGYRIESG